MRKNPGTWFIKTARAGVNRWWWLFGGSLEQIELLSSADC
ncbi:hypothetical protein J2T14_005983 [Paenibacillus harenae]|nr:hypothetical protein [Paenibacillus harenae]